jgi:hypothetical protein
MQIIHLIERSTGWFVMNTDQPVVYFPQEDVCEARGCVEIASECEDRITALESRDEAHRWLKMESGLIGASLASTRALQPSGELHPNLRQDLPCQR